MCHAKQSRGNLTYKTNTPRKETQSMKMRQVTDHRRLSTKQIAFLRKRREMQYGDLRTSFRNVFSTDITEDALVKLLGLQQNAGDEDVTLIEDGVPSSVESGVELEPQFA